MEYAPQLVSWNITSGCNLRCPHCYLDAGQRDPAELSTEDALHLVDEMARAGTEMLILTGGEPMLRADLPQIAARASAHGINVVLGTTGTLLTRDKARQLREAGVSAAGISIDSCDAEKHDAFRGVPGAWRAAVDGIEACRGEGLEVLVHTTALRMNREEIPQIAELAHGLGAFAFNLFFLVCTGRGEQLTDLSPAEYEQALEFVLGSQHRYPGMLVRARCAPYIGRLALERGESPLAGAGCLAATEYCRVTPTGDVTPCPYLPMVAGNVRENRFDAIWESSDVLDQFREPQLGGKCGQCAYGQGASAPCGGCRARAFALTGDLLAADPWCRFEPDQSLVDAAAAASRDVLPVWTEEASARIEHVPSFLRGRVRRSAEAYAQEKGLPEVTVDVLQHLRQRAFGGAAPPAMPAALSPSPGPDAPPHP